MICFVPRLRQQRSNKRIGLILDTSATLFRELGYDNTSTKHVADRAGIAVGSIYHWFPDKAALAAALAERYLEQLHSIVRAESAASRDASAADAIAALAWAVARMGVDQPAFVTLLSLAYAPNGANSAGDRLRRGLFDQFAAVIAAHDDSYDPESTRLIISAIVAVIHGALAEASRMEDATSRAAAMTEQQRVLTSYLAKRFPAPQRRAP